MDPTFAAALRAEILTKGAAVLDGPDDRRLFMVHSTAMSMPGQGILFALEGGGVFFWRYAAPDEPALNIFRLISAGFSAAIAKAILSVVDGLDVADTSPTRLPPAIRG
jgi:hypothetical protein